MTSSCVASWTRQTSWFVVSSSLPRGSRPSAIRTNTKGVTAVTISHVSGRELIGSSFVGSNSHFLRGGQNRPRDQKIVKKVRTCGIRVSAVSVKDDKCEDTQSEKNFLSQNRRNFFVSGSLFLSVFGIFNFPTQFQTARAGTPILVEEDVRAAIQKVLKKEKAAGVLRLVFHDAGTYEIFSNSGGMNGSLIYELDRPENGGLKRSLKVLQKVRLELGDASVVSWADLIAVSGAQAVSLCGGPQIYVGLGRRDQSVPDPEDRMPSETLSASDLKASFQSKGFSTQEMVVLSGAHTLGSKGFGSPVVFDNSYFTALLEKKWEIVTVGEEMKAMVGIPSDHSIANDEECLEWIRLYASDQKTFFDDFSKAYLKLTNCGAQWGTA